MPAKIDLTGRIFGRLTVLKEDKDKKLYYICRCTCGTIKSIKSQSLRVGTSKSCGCLQKDLLYERTDNPENRFWDKVDKTGDCWLWTAGRDGKGYGSFYVGRNRKAIKSYRFSYEIKNGKVPTGFELDHKCHNNSKTCLGGNNCKHRLCVNPDHLEIVTKRENLMRGNSPAAINARKTQCNNGHEYTSQTTYINPTNGKRRCLVCRDEYRRKYWLDKRDNRNKQTGVQ